jgi:indole-3-glycerol phosphate synthase
MTILDDIIRYKRTEELPKQIELREAASVRAEAFLAEPPRDFIGALRKAKGVALIAEVKKASPSKGVLRAKFDHMELATIYDKFGAAAISVLTDARYFQGSLNNLIEIRQSVKCPVLRKDFIFDPYQVYEARAAEADAILLIAAVLSDEELSSLFALAHKLGLTVLIEVHNRAELERVLPLKPRLIGVNNRNLHDFSVDLQICINLRQYIPSDICMVAESGIHDTPDVERLGKEGIDAILVGEALVKAKDVARKVRDLTRKGIVLREDIN